MYKGKYNTTSQMLLQQGKAIMSSSDESHFHFRLFAVNMVLSGYPTSSIGTMAMVCKVTFIGWVKTADQQGSDALRPKEYKGRTAKLT